MTAFQYLDSLDHQHQLAPGNTSGSGLFGRRKAATFQSFVVKYEASRLPMNHF
jgi:hypothetical protein